TNLAAVGAGTLAEAETLAVSAEGVDMSVLGWKLTLVQELLKRELENIAITKKVGITLHNVVLSSGDGLHLASLNDTLAAYALDGIDWASTGPVYHQVLSLGDGLHLASLNDTLAAYNCKPKPPRDHRAFVENPTFRAKRSLDEQMKKLEAAQLRAATHSQAERCFRESLNNLCRFRSGFADTVEIHPSQLLEVVDDEEAENKALESLRNAGPPDRLGPQRGGAIGAFLEARDGPPATVIVHAPTEKSLKAAVAALNEYAQPARHTYISPYYEGYFDDDGYGDFAEDFAKDWYYRSPLEE
ncbi:hypothetical protein T492DRAFT_871264, partial [Pavlovales sp. CCMP2436]